MKRVKSSCVAAILTSVFLATPERTLGSNLPLLDVTTKSINKEEVSIKLSLENIPRGTKALEVGICGEEIISIGMMKWSKSLSDSYRGIRSHKDQEKGTKVSFYVVAPNDCTLGQEELDLGELTLMINEARINNNANTYLKLINEDNIPYIYDNINVVMG